MSNTANNPTKVITGPNTRWSYCNAWEAKAINGGTPKFSVSLIIPKSDKKTIARIEEAIKAAYREGEAKLKGNGRSVPALSVLKTPLRDGDVERPDDEAYADSYFVNANACIDPRFKYVTRGCAEYAEWLGQKENPAGKGWAAGAGYGGKILSILKGILMNSVSAQVSYYSALIQNNPERSRRRWNGGRGLSIPPTLLQGR